MTGTLFIVLAIEAVIATAPAVLFIPRARQSPAFDRVLWIATWVLAFLGAWYAPSMIAADSSWNSVVIGDVPIIPTMLGAVVGAVLLNGLLFVMDRFGGQEEIAEELIANELPAELSKTETVSEPAPEKIETPKEQDQVT